MKHTGATLAVHTLEALGIVHTVGIPMLVISGGIRRDIEDDAIERAVDLLTDTEQPGLYVGWGAVDGRAE